MRATTTKVPPAASAHFRSVSVSRVCSWWGHNDTELCKRPLEPSDVFHPMLNLPSLRSWRYHAPRLTAAYRSLACSSYCKESCRLHLEASPVLVEWHRTPRAAANSAVLVANSIYGHEPHSRVLQLRTSICFVMSKSTVRTQLPDSQRPATLIATNRM